MKTIGDLTDHADRMLSSGEHAAALHAFAGLTRLQPENIDARLRVADALLAMGKAQEAAVVYTAFLRHTMNAGFPLRALVAAKVLTALEPQLASLLGSFADLYSEGAAKLSGRAVRISPGDPEQLLPEGFSLAEPPAEEDLVSAATEIGKDTSAIATYPEHLPPIPLLSELPPEVFQQVIATLKLVRLKAGVPIVKEGDPGDSFFVLSRGLAAVTRKDADGTEKQLVELGDGAIFGEMALVSTEARTATVRTLTSCDLLKFDRAALGALAGEVESFSQKLEGFSQRRLINNLLATGPLFRPLDRKQRYALLRRFAARQFESGASIIEEGQPGKGLYVVLSGAVDVTKVDGDDQVLLATLAPGQLFGEISLINDSSTTASVRAAEKSTVLFLAKTFFQPLISAVPEIGQYIEELGDDRAMDTRLLLDDAVGGVEEVWDDIEIELTV